jgi:hypothetical protein
MVPGTIDLVCSRCGHMVRVNAKRAGQHFSCPACDENLYIPQPHPPAPSSLGNLLFACRRFPFFWQRVRVFDGGLELARETVLWRDVVAIERSALSLHVFARGRRMLLLRNREAIEKVLVASSPYIVTRTVEEVASA